MATIAPETYKLMLERANWKSPSDVHMLQAMAADDVTLTNLYAEFVESRELDKDQNNS